MATRSFRKSVLTSDLRLSLGLLAGGASLVMLLSVLPSTAEGKDESKVKTGFEIAPVDLDLTGKNRALVGLGSYIVNAQGACNDCHTSPPFAPGGNPFAGEPKVINADDYLAGGTAFGPFISRNITPCDGEGRPAGLTLEDFVLVMRTGADLHSIPPEVPPGVDLLQVMPWVVYREMTDRDLEAVYEYLSAIPAHLGCGVP